MKDKAYYIEKAKRQRGLTDEQINFFLQNHPRWDLLPHYACYVKKMGMQRALEQVRAEFDNVADLATRECSASEEAEG